MNNLQKCLLALLMLMLIGIGIGGLMIFNRIGDMAKTSENLTYTICCSHYQ